VIEDLQLPLQLTGSTLVRIETAPEGERNAVIQFDDGRLIRVTIRSHMQNIRVRSIMDLDEIVRIIASPPTTPRPTTTTTMVGTAETLLRDVGEPVCRCVVIARTGSTQVAKIIQTLRYSDHLMLTSTMAHCEHCHGFTQHHIIHPVPSNIVQRGIADISITQRRRILDIIGRRDPFHGRELDVPHIDHRFPTIRMGGMIPNIDAMSPDTIESTFQILSRNDNKRKADACVRCVATGRRGCPTGERGEEMFSSGGPTWDPDTPTSGAGAEPGCSGCGWHDVVGFLATTGRTTWAMPTDDDPD